MNIDEQSILDYFAGKAMQVMYVEGIAGLERLGDSPEFSVIARDAYRLAEAMMNERNERASLCV